MKRIVLSTSSSGLDNHSIPHDINLLRLYLHVNGVEFIDGKNINNEKLQYIMTKIATSPVHTSPVSASEVSNKLSELYLAGYRDIFITTLSTKMSDSYNVILQVAHSFKDKLNIYIYDCKDLNVCEAMLALEADHMLKQNASFTDIAKRLDDLRNNHRMLFAVNDLSYLVKNKKLSTTAGFFANLFDIKPVLHVDNDGNIVPVNKIRHIDKTLNFIVDSFIPTMLNEKVFPYVLVGGDEELNQYFIKLVKTKLRLQHIATFPVSTISTANHGPFAVGLCAFKNHIPQAAQFYAQNSY